MLIKQWVIFQLFCFDNLEIEGKEKRNQRRREGGKGEIEKEGEKKGEKKRARKREKARERERKKERKRKRKI